MRKQVVKKLYTFYSVEEEFDKIKNDPNHIMKSYSAGVAECIKYHDDLNSWINDITSGKFKNGFGLKILTEDGKENVDIYRYDLICYTHTCKTKPIGDILEIMANIVLYYNDDSNTYYYEIEDDNIYSTIEFTGHQYYKSPYESCDNCGTCDGARCQTCKKLYIVKDLVDDKEYYIGGDANKAEHCLKENQKIYTHIANDIMENYKISEELRVELLIHADLKTIIKVLHFHKIPYITYNR